MEDEVLVKYAFGLLRWCRHEKRNTHTHTHTESFEGAGGVFRPKNNQSETRGTSGGKATQQWWWWLGNGTTNMVRESQPEREYASFERTSRSICIVCFLTAL